MNTSSTEAPFSSPAECFGPQINGERLRTRMYEKHLTQVDMALVSGLTQKTISNVINSRHQAGFETRYRVAAAVKALGLDDGTIISGEDVLVDYQPEGLPAPFGG